MAELTFLINGTEYAIPQLDTFTIDECGIFHTWTDVHVEDIDETPVNSQMIAAFMQIAYMRGNPGIKAQTARDLVGQSNFAEALERFTAVEEEDDAGPPEVKPSEPRPNGSLDETNSPPKSSGTASTTPSATPANDPSRSGQPSSVESAASASLRSVV